MGAIVTSKFRTQNLMVFIDQFKTTGNVATDNYLYLGFGRSDAWADDAQGNNESSGQFTLPDPLDEDESQYWADIVGAKRIQNDDISPVLPRIDWNVGDTLAFDGDTANGIVGIAEPARSFVSKTGYHSIVMNSEYRVYQCVGEPATGKCYVTGIYDTGVAGSRAVCEATTGGLWLPTGASEEPIGKTGDGAGLVAQDISTSDSYIWKFLYKLELNDIINSTTNDWMPVITGTAVLSGSEQMDFGDEFAIFTAKCHHGLIHVRLETSDNFPENDDFRQIGLLRNPELSGGGTRAQGSVYAAAVSQMQADSGQLIYLENRRAITRASDQIEDLKLVVEF
jgi:hypothetical protein